MAMKNCKVWLAVFATIALVLLPVIECHVDFAPAPAPTSDGTTIDQGVACGLMLLALVLTYLIHIFDVPPFL